MRTKAVDPAGARGRREFLNDEYHTPNPLPCAGSQQVRSNCGRRAAGAFNKVF